MTTTEQESAALPTTRSVPARAFITTLDQCVSSGSNFAVGVVVARLAGASGLGAYALAYASWLLVAAMHRALVTDPMAIMGDARDPVMAKANVRKGFASEVALGVSCGAVIALLGLALLFAGQRSFGISQLAVAPWITFLLLQDYWRWIGFMQAKPGKALANDVVFDLVQIAGFAFLLVAHIHSIPLVIAAWGLGAVGGALFGVFEFRVMPSFRGGLQWLRAKWPVSRWLAGTSASGWGLSQVQGILTAALLGPAALGGLKAAQGLVSGPAFVLVQAGGSLGLPEASRSYDKHGWAGLNRVSRLITVAGMASVGLVFAAVLLFGRFLLGLLYGHQFAQYEPTALILAVAYIFTSCCLGAILELKIVKRTRVLFLVSLWGLFVSTVAVIALAPAGGVRGVAYSYAVGTALYSSALIVAARWVGRRERRASVAKQDEPLAIGVGTVGTTEELEPQAVDVATGGYGPMLDPALLGSWYYWVPRKLSPRSGGTPVVSPRRTGSWYSMEPRKVSTRFDDTSARFDATVDTRAPNIYEPDIDEPGLDQEALSSGHR